MECAAGKERLDVVKFLHANLRERCDSNAAAIAASFRQYDTLMDNGSQASPESVNQKKWGSYRRRYVALFLALYAKADLSAELLDSLIGNSDFAMIERLLFFSRGASKSSTEESENYSANLSGTIERKLAYRFR